MATRPPSLLADQERIANHRRLTDRLIQFPLRVAERKLLLAAGDLFAINASLAGLVALSSPFTLSLSELWHRLHWFVLLAGLWFLCSLALDVYDLARAASPIRSSWTAGGAAALTSGLYVLIPYLTPQLNERRLFIFLFVLGSTAAIIIWRVTYATVFNQPAFQQRELVIGAGRAAQALARTIAAGQEESRGMLQSAGYCIVGFIDDDPALQGQRVENIPVLGMGHELFSIVHSRRPDELVVAMPVIPAGLFQAVLDCRESGIPVTTMTALYERITGRVPVEYAGRDLQVVLPVTQPAAFRLYAQVRHFFELLVALAGCVLIVALVPPIWLINRMSAPGDVFYWQERVGEKGIPYRLFKFRSMVMGAEKESGAVWSSKGDSRVTLAGRFLRRTRLDELPQCWNIVRGEMALIGPRPERPEFVRPLSREVVFYRLRHAVKPGLTGWAQVQYGYGASRQETLIKLEYDLYYIKHQSPYLDLQILLKTVQVVFGLRGR